MTRHAVPMRSTQRIPNSAKPQFVVIHKTLSGIEIGVFKGKKPQSKHDFVVAYMGPHGKPRRPNHVHLIVEMYLKHGKHPRLTSQFRDYLLRLYPKVPRVTAFPPKLTIFKRSHVKPFKTLNDAGYYDVEFLLVLNELLFMQEKTNYPNGSLTEKLYESFCRQDMYSVIRRAVFRG